MTLRPADFIPLPKLLLYEHLLLQFTQLSSGSVYWSWFTWFNSFLRHGCIVQLFFTFLKGRAPQSIHLTWRYIIQGPINTCFRETANSVKENSRSYATKYSQNFSTN